MIEDILRVTLVVAFAIVSLFLVAEVLLAHWAWRQARDVVSLRERGISAACRFFGVLVFMVLILNRVFFNALSVDEIAVAGGLAVLVLAVPAVRFVWLYYSHGFARRKGRPLP